MKERIRFIAKKPKVLGTAVVLAAALMAVVFVCAFIKSSENIRIVAFGEGKTTVTGADMQIPLPENVLEVCGQVMEEGNDDVIIYHVEAGQEVGRFARMSLKDVLQLVDEGRQVLPLGNYGDNYLLKAYLGIPISVTMHTYTPAGPDGEEESEAASDMLPQEDIFSMESLDGTQGVPGTDSNTDVEYVLLPDQSDATQIPAPEDTDSYTFPLPYEKGQSLSAEEYVEEDDTTYVLDDKVDYLPNEEITTTVYPAKEINVDELHSGCYVYIKADYSSVKDRYLEEMEQLSRELESVEEGVVVLSLNGEIREELLDNLTKNRTPYVGDNSKVGALINALPVPPTLNDTGEFSLQTVTEPYSLRFHYEMTQDSMSQEDLDMMYFNAAMLFYAIGNVDEITIYIKHPSGGTVQSSRQVYYRADMEAGLVGLSEADYEDEQVFRDRLAELHERVLEYIRAQR